MRAKEAPLPDAETLLQLERAARGGHRLADIPVSRPERAGAARVQERARRGVSGAGGQMPHLAAIQRSFGAHDVSSVVAHTGASAASEAMSIGARAFTIGEHVAFAGTPTLRTAAHEAAHVVQQRAGIRIEGGVGQEGDAHERHADAVAEDVVAGRSAERALARYEEAPAPSAAPPVQRLDVKEKEQVAWLAKQSAKFYKVADKTLAPFLEEVAGFDDVNKALEHVMARVREKILGTVRHSQVSPEAMKRLHAASAAIDYAKKVVVNGAGNQIETVHHSKGNAKARMDRAKVAEKWGFESDAEDSSTVAASAAAAGGASCREYTALIYEFLKAKGVGPLMICSMKSADHTFVVIGDVKKEGDDTLVAADAWPTISQAVLLQDHMAQTKANLKPGSLRPSGGGGPRTPQVQNVDEMADRLSATHDATVSDLLDMPKMNYAPSVTHDLSLVLYTDHQDGVMNEGHDELRVPPLLRSKAHEKERLGPLAAKPKASGGGIKARLEEIENDFIEAPSTNAGEAQARLALEALEKEFHDDGEALQAIAEMRKNLLGQ